MTGRPVVAVWRTELGAPSETFIVNQVAAMRRWRPVLVGLRRAQPSLPLGEHLLLDEHGTWGRARRSLMWRAGWDAAAQAALSTPSVGLVHAHFAVDALAVRTSARLARCPLVFTAHGYDVTSHAPALTGSPIRSGWGDLVGMASAVIAVSDHIAGRVEAMGVPTSKIVVRHIGIPLPTPAPYDGPRKGVVFVGRLVEKKGVADLLEAVARLGEPLRSTPVRVVGDGPLRGELEDTARRLGLDVTFLGRQPPAVVADELARGRVFCAPSRTAANGDVEGFGMVFLEAAAAGLPVVTYDSGGTSEAVAHGRTGLVVPERDVEALSAALGSLLLDPARAQALGAAGRRRVVEEFQVGPMTAQLEDLYDAVARPVPR